MTEVFKTNIEDYGMAKRVYNMLFYHFPFYEINFDLYDKDHILRVESGKSAVDPTPIMRLIRMMGFDAQVLEG